MSGTTGGGKRQGKSGRHSRRSVEVVAAWVGGGLAAAGAVTAALITTLGSPSVTPSPATSGATSSAAPGPTPRPTTAQGASSQPPATMTLQIQPAQGVISKTFTVSGTGCPPGEQIDIFFDGKVLYTAPTCQADHTFQKTYAPGENGILTWVDGAGTDHPLTLSPGSTYTVQACTTTAIHQVCSSSRVTYRVL
jgi:hypothetical protein